MLRTRVLCEMSATPMTFSPFLFCLESTPVIPDVRDRHPSPAPVLIRKLKPRAQVVQAPPKIAFEPW